MQICVNLLIRQSTHDESEFWIFIKILYNATAVSSEMVSFRRTIFFSFVFFFSTICLELEVYKRDPVSSRQP